VGGDRRLSTKAVRRSDAPPYRWRRDSLEGREVSTGGGGIDGETECSQGWRSSAGGPDPVGGKVSTLNQVIWKEGPSLTVTAPTLRNKRLSLEREKGRPRWGLQKGVLALGHTGGLCESKGD